MIAFLRAQAKRRRWIFVVAGLALLAGIAIWFFSRPKPSNETLTHAEYRDLKAVLEFSGVVDAKEHVSLRFASGGKVVFVGAKEGDTVKKWQTLASLDQRSMQKNLQQYLNSYETQRLTFENKEDGRNDRAIETTEQRVARQDQLALEQTVLNVEMQSVAIEGTRLSSPIAGILVKSPVAVTGMHVTPTDIFEVVNPDTLYFRVFVDEVDISHVNEGQESEVVLDAFPGENISAVVTKIAFQSAQSQSGTVFPIELQFKDPAIVDRLRLGMNGEARLITNAKQHVLSLPIEAVVTRGDVSQVKVKKADGTMEDRTVTLGIESEDYVEVLSGINEEDQVVIP